MSANMMKEAAETYLKSQGWTYRWDPRFRAWIVDFDLTHVSNCRVLICPRKETLLVKTVHPLRAMPEQYGAVATFLTHVNFNIIQGGFALDATDGEIRFRSSHWTTDGVPSLETIERVVDIGLHMTERFTPGLLAVMFQGVAPLAAYERIMRPPTKDTSEDTGTDEADDDEDEDGDDDGDVEDEATGGDDDDDDDDAIANTFDD